MVHRIDRDASGVAALRARRGGPPRREPGVRAPARREAVPGLRRRSARPRRWTARRAAARGAKRQDAAGAPGRAGAQAAVTGLRHAKAVAARRGPREPGRGAAADRPPPPAARPPALGRGADPLRSAVRPRPHAARRSRPPRARGWRSTRSVSSSRPRTAGASRWRRRSRPISKRSPRGSTRAPRPARRACDRLTPSRDRRLPEETTDRMKPLPRRRLGTNGPEITTVGFGAWATGGGGWSFGWGAQDDDASIAAIRHAVSLGVNWIDTAAVYGLGHSEEVVGRAIAEHPARRAAARLHEVRPALEPGRPDGGRRARLEPGADPRGVRSLAAAPGRRGDRPLPVPLARPVGDAARGLVGRDDAAPGPGQGALHRRLELHDRALEGCEKLRHVQSLQPPFSLIRRDMAASELPWCAGARHGRHRLQPDAVGAAHRRLQRRARGRHAAPTTGAGARPTSRSRTSAATSRCATRCGRSREARGERSARWRSRGRSRGRASPAPSSAPAAPSRWTAGSRAARSSSTPRTRPRSPARSSGPPRAPGRCARRERAARSLPRLSTTRSSRATAPS